jgi:hypothetical protein
MPQVSIQFARSILYAMAFINYYIAPMYLAQFRSIVFVHQIFIRCQKDIEFLMHNLFPEKKQ